MFSKLGVMKSGLNFNDILTSCELHQLITVTSLSYARCQLLGLETLEKRRMVAQGTFMFKLLTGRINALLLLSNVNFYVPTRSLRTRQFLITDFRYRLFCARDPLLLSNFRSY